ncbi:MAG: hypothetical protein GEU94_02035 [Micromonosporaceae bacterium]|nr:hypothetical protein [Micromonosporaceae bacterium]
MDDDVSVGVEIGIQLGYLLAEVIVAMVAARTQPHPWHAMQRRQLHPRQAGPGKHHDDLAMPGDEHLDGTQRKREPAQVAVVGADEDVDRARHC